MDFESLMCVRASESGWDWSSIGSIMFRYLDRCNDAMCIPNPDDFDAYLAECQANETGHCGNEGED